MTTPAKKLLTELDVSRSVYELPEPGQYLASYQYSQGCYDFTTTSNVMAAVNFNVSPHSGNRDFISGCHDQKGHFRHVVATIRIYE